MIAQKFEFVRSSGGIGRLLRKVFITEVIPFQPKRMSEFLKEMGYTSEGKNYYIFVAGEQDILGKAGVFYKFGVMAVYDNEFIFHDGFLAWKVPFGAVGNIEWSEGKRLGLVGASVKISFNTEQGEKTCVMACPLLVGEGVPSNLADDKWTRDLFETLEKKKLSVGG